MMGLCGIAHVTEHDISFAALRWNAIYEAL
jgi:hypothetical protein